MFKFYKEKKVTLYDAISEYNDLRLLETVKEDCLHISHKEMFLLHFDFDSQCFLFN